MKRLYSSLIFFSFALCSLVLAQGQDQIDNSNAVSGEEESFEQDASTLFTLGCPKLASEEDFSSIRQQVRIKAKSDAKMTLAKALTREQCLSTKQIADLVQLFVTEDEKLEYAKFAWHYCHDPSNFKRVSLQLEFSDSRTDLSGYIEAQE